MIGLTESCHELITPMRQMWSVNDSATKRAENVFSMRTPARIWERKKVSEIQSQSFAERLTAEIENGGKKLF